MNKKKVFTLALAVCLIAILSLSTLAWFTDDDSVNNNFYVAASDDDTADEIFSVDVWENYDENDDGTDERYDVGINYEDILPGDELQKEAYVENTGYYDQYVRVIITVSNASVWKDVFELTDVVKVDITKLVSGIDMDEVYLVQVCYDEENDALSYVLYYTDALASGDVIEVFDTVTIPEAMTREQAAELAGSFTIGVVAEAVQTENVGDNVYEAFVTVGMEIEEDYIAAYTTEQFINALS